MDIIKKGFGEQLRIVRKIKGLTQEYLAEKIGINLRQLARIEAGESFISSETLFRICDTLQISPRTLFDFGLEEVVMTGSGKTLHFNVIKNDNIITLKHKNNKKLDENDDLPDYDLKFIAMAQRLQKDICVTEIENGIELCSKLFTPNGKIKKISQNNNKDKFETLKTHINTIAEDPKKLDYMCLAFNSLHNTEALNELKILIKGIELTQQ